MCRTLSCRALAPQGSAYNKYLEVYNPTPNEVSLAAYSFPSTSNGATGDHEYWNTFDEGAVVPANGVYVICHPQANAAIQKHCNESHQVGTAPSVPASGR